MENTQYVSSKESKSTQKPVSPFKIIMYTILFITIFISILLFKGFFFIVHEDEVAVVSEFGKITKIIVDRDNMNVDEQNKLNKKFTNVEIIKDKGLFFKLPFITKIDRHTSKLLTYQSNSENINTKEKRQYQVTMYGQWEITHPGLFQMKLGSVNRANAILDDLIYPVVIKRINKLESEIFLTDKEAVYLTLEEGLEKLNETIAENGIIVKDIEIYRTLLPTANIESTYRKMVAEREAIAQQIRSEGQELYQKTVADTDKEVAQILAESIETSEKVKGEADANALEIYANGFSRDPEFYEFWKTLNSYKNTIDENTVIIMDKNNKFLKYFSQD